MQLDIIHTGQHYDYEMTKIFFEGLHLPDPIANLDVGSGTHARQMAKIMTRLEPKLLKQNPDLVIVPGDTNSTLAAGLTATKLHIPVAHMEAGARSYDMSMPEEINRRLTDHCSTLLFTPTENCTENLLKEGINRDKIHQIGDTMYDALLLQLRKAENTKILKKLNLKPKSYVMLTIHRPENVDQPKKLENVMTAITRLTPIKIVFPVHPRTKKQLLKYKMYNNLQRQKHIKLIPPTGYHETIKLIKNAELIVTDSGGMQKEAFWLKTPCITLRRNTEWVETIKLKANYLASTEPQKLLELVHKIMENETKIRKNLERLQNPFGDGNASQRILNIIKNY